ncbi:arabinose efflux permease family protein [Desulfocapsa sulfexigens DSM 10523]|uniref:Arabinose efflux permease family protein n=1 Tax=Desulfocapsa sulfexigens (strain DSM 10523 / SB164P1) TaxID=1167006 RepID=M1PJJ0_DESSD|nr:MFS transporter [Desulfocapsa sulfexigens]AGF76666.1 arabinose efflux permease family protein [Desulfocapsa sulfexigens DSM 10523]
MKAEQHSSFRLQCIVFALVSASFTNVYITQPVLPVLQNEFSVDMVLVSFSVSAVILGIALSNLPFGVLVDRVAIQPIILNGGLMVVLGGLLCSFTENFWFFLGGRFLQGLFIPCLTTCLAAYLAKTLPLERLSVVMGSYVSATVLGGLSGRLLGGWIHPPLHWRYAFVSAALLTLVATVVAVRGLPRATSREGKQPDLTGFIELLKRWDLLRMYFCAMGSFAIFSSVFNYLPYRLIADPFAFSTESITLLYLVYVVGIFIGPISGRLSNRFGSGQTLLLGSGFLGGALLLILLPFLPAVIVGLLGVCGGFFTIHAAAVGSLNRKLRSGQGRANALYVMFYYLGGWLGITGSGFVYKQGGWSWLVLGLLLLLLIPIGVAVVEYGRDRQIAVRS